MNSSNNKLNLFDDLICINCQCTLINSEKKITCVKCKSSFPIVNNIPVLIKENNSIFNIADFVNESSTTFDRNYHNPSKFQVLVNYLTPSISMNLFAKKNYKLISDILPEDAKILIVGGSILGEGIEELYVKKDFQIVCSDVSFGPEIDIICDAHDLPFENDYFDCVIIQAVLEHVLSPERCIAEVYRVLNKSGIVYSETPFMQQVHMRQYDFQRYTNLGHIRLFNNFNEIKSGPCGGPGMALAWSIRYFLVSFVSSTKFMRYLDIVIKYFLFILKYFDFYLINKTAAYDSASSFYFIGKKSDKKLSDRDLIKRFIGFS